MNNNFSIERVTLRDVDTVWSVDVPTGRPGDFLFDRVACINQMITKIESLRKTAQPGQELPVEKVFYYRGECILATDLLKKHGITFICKECDCEPCQYARRLSQKVDESVNDRLPDHHKHALIFSK